MPKLLTAKAIGPHRLELSFSDKSHGIFDGENYLSSRTGSLLEPLRNPSTFANCFVEAGGLSWPIGLSLSAVRLQELMETPTTPA
jgi:hypothetical protein